MPEKILIVDDDQAMLEFTKYVLKDIGCPVIIMNDPVAALEYLSSEEIAVLVSDNNMPVMRGLELIEKANIVASETVKIIMSAYTDLAVALCAINQCQVFKIVTKPWQQEAMFETVTDALHRYRTLQTIRRENEDVLRSLAQTIELKDHYTKGHCDRVATFSVQIARALGLSIDMQREIKYGSWLHDCGKIGVPEQILNANRKLTSDEYELIKNHPSWGADVAKKANLSAIVSNVILCHHERFDGTGYPRGISGMNIPIEARIVSVADVFDALSSDRPYREGLSPEESMRIVVSMKGKELDPALVELFIKNQKIASKENELSCGDEIVTKDQYPVNKFILKGDFSVGGVNEQMPFLIQHLAFETAAMPNRVDRNFPYTLDLSGVQVLDACGCQLLAIFLRALRKQGIEMFSFVLNDYYRKQIQLLGFDEAIFTGECI
ncbi:MAG: HD domain-containing phosphohydrolase [Pseudomonadota bacterium]